MKTNFKEIPIIHDIKSVPFYEPEIISFAKSRAYLWNDQDTEIIYLNIIFNAGNSRDNDFVLSNAMHSIIMLGTEKLKSSEISMTIESLGGKVRCTPNQGQTILNISAPKNSFIEVLKIGLDAFINAIYPEKEVELYKTKKKQSLQIQKEKTSYISSEKTKELSFGHDHIYGRKIKNAMYDKLEGSILNDLKEKYFNINNCIYALSGCFNSDILNETQNIINSLPNGNKFEDIFLQKPNPESKFDLFVQKNNSMQATVSLKKWTLAPYTKDFPDLLLLNVILGGYFGSRLMQNIREDKGWTYGIHSAINYYSKELCSFGINCEVENGKSERALEEIIKEMNILKTELIQPAELNKAKNYYLGNLLKSYSLKFKSSNILLPHLQYDRPFDYHNTLTNGILNSNPEKILQLANTIFDSETFYKVIVGDKN